MFKEFRYRFRSWLIREPKVIGPVKYDEGTERRILEGLGSFGIKTKEFAIDVERYKKYFNEAGYKKKYPNYYPWNIAEKSLEHFIAAELLSIQEGSVYIDIASENSPAPEIYSRLFGCRAYRQDLNYPEGFNGERIGGDASNMPVPDGFADRMALHCSLEHFECDSDIAFVKEAYRVLRPGGRCCIVPLYMYEKYAVQTDPLFSGGVEFEDDATVYCARGWNNRHGRFYDPAHLKERILDNLGGLSYTIYRITNVKDVDASCYVRFALLLEKRV